MCQKHQKFEKNSFKECRNDIFWDKEEEMFFCVAFLRILKINFNGMLLILIARV